MLTNLTNFRASTAGNTGVMFALVLVPLLLGLGVDDLSAAPSLLPAIKYLVRRLKFSEAQQLATFALNCENSAEILAHSEALARRSAPSLFKSRI